MEDQATPMNEVFLDTAFAIALSSPKDTHHEQAVKISEQLETEGTLLVTTRSVVIEIGNALAKQPFRTAAIELIESLEQDPNTKINPVSEELYKRAFELYHERQDKQWGMTDCIVCSYAGPQLADSADHRSTLSTSWVSGINAD